MSEEVLLAHPLKVRAIASARIKNDRIDSDVLAHLLRANLIPATHAPSREIRALRPVLRQRMFFVQLRTMLRNRVPAVRSSEFIRDHYRKVKSRRGTKMRAVQQPASLHRSPTQFGASNAAGRKHAAKPAPRDSGLPSIKSWA